jgi:hypothetical protein
MHSPIADLATHPHPYPSRAPRFHGQAADEVVVALRRPAVLTLLVPGWPMLLGLATLAALLWGQLSGAIAATVAASLTVPVALLTLALLCYWGFTHALPWWFRLGVVTNKRVLVRHGILKSDIQAIPLEAVGRVAVVQPDLAEWLLGYGRVEVYSGSNQTPLVIKGIAHPQAFASAIAEAQRVHTPPHVRPTVADADLRTLLDRMGQGASLPPAPTLDRRLTRAWPLRRGLPIDLPQGEELVGIISRHWWVLAQKMGAPLALLSGACAVALAGLWGRVTLWPFAVVLGLGAVLLALLLYLNFVDDAFILTTQRILTVKRRYFVLFAQEDVITYDKIQKCRATFPGLFSRLLQCGNVEIAVSGDAPPELLDMVPYPALAFAEIERVREVVNQRATVASANNERGEIRDWFAEVLAEMVVSTPELRGLTLEDALVRTYSQGMRLMVLGDTVALPGYPPGLVVSQSPSAGARALRGGDISVMLSRS